MPFTIEANFYCHYKIGDNVNYNLEILDSLYSMLGENQARSYLLYKNIIIINVSIIEAVLADFYSRIKKHTYEGVPNITEAFTELVQKKKISDFTKYINYARDNNVFGQNPDIYDQLIHLQAVRNRVHIQDLERHREHQKKLSRNDRSVFTDNNLKRSEKSLEFIIKMLNKFHPREDNKSSDYVNEHDFPWEPYFK